ncbi:T9SS type A sorting domain-containing protein [Aurantibacillus circumpalustris]|uniref:T9SS type A sorting domain-containing protein n=1 Tax=Aurantibacillus circumpalustris TaxID=3036359 RepID=UPI00295A8551|nr:T9SS type A sorting domain-containing protein [Aurantibacillus circumpalustris]
MKKHILFSFVILLITATNFIAQTFIPVAATGYTLDGVAENTTAIGTTGGAMDGSNFNLYSQYYGTLYNPVGVGLPNNGTIVNGSRTYQLQSYTGPNVLFIQPNLKDSLTFVTPQPFPIVSLLSFATQGSAVINVTVRFTDNTTQVFTGLGLADWFTANPSVYNGFDRVLRTTGVPAYVGSAGNPRMFGTDLSILCANQAKFIKRVVIQNTSTTAYVCVMAVAGSVPGYSANASAMCTGGTSTISGSGFATYTWQPVGSFLGSNAGTINVSPSATTIYTLNGTDGNGCPGYTTITVNVSSSSPVLSLTGSSQSVCLGAAATLSASGAVNYTWTNGVTNGVPFYPSVTTTYSVTGSNGCGSVTSVRTISVGPIPVSLVSSATTICTNKTATLSITAAANTYTWLPINSIGSSSSIVVNPSVTTIYTITASDGTCAGTSTISLIAKPSPTVTTTSTSGSICVGTTVNLLASGGTNYTWTPVNLNTQSISVTPVITTTYTVVGDNSFGCFDSSTQIIIVGFQPTVNALATGSAVCVGGSATLTASGANSYAWTNGPATNIYIISPTQLTNYTVTGISSLSGCSETKTISVTVFIPTLTISGNATICAGSQASLTASGANNYNWAQPVGLPFPGITVSPLVNTVYSVNATGTSGFLNCPVSGSIEVIVNPVPTLTASIKKAIICVKETNTLTAGGANSYTWTSTTNTIVGSSITVTPTIAITVIYTVTGTNSFGCETSLIEQMQVKTCAGLESLDLNGNHLKIYPNPSKGDFIIESENDIQFNIINELGQVIKQIQLNNENDFKYSVSGISDGIYFIVGNNVTMKIVVSK